MTLASTIPRLKIASTLVSGMIVSHTCILSLDELTIADGELVVGNGTENFHSCRDSDFDQYGDIGAFEIWPEVGFVTAFARMSTDS